MATPTRTIQVLGTTFGSGGGSSEIPVFDLAAMGLAAIPFSGGSATLEDFDTTEICTALDKGAVTFIVPLIDSGVAANVSITMHSANVEGEMYTSTITLFFGAITYLTIFVDSFSSTLNVIVSPLTDFIGAYIDEALGGEY